MNISATSIAGLPGPAKAVLAVVAGGSLLVVVWYAVGGNEKVMFILAVGMIIVVLLLVAYKFLLGWMRKRRANPLGQGIAGNAAAAPQGISEPARRARLDDLRRNFEQGVEKFRAAGKNLYSVPWYVLVGEPGSGKTEAIRHCNVGFPPGLQDQLQGAGGTLNMNWWFTNQAIILDTAGRLMFEEVVPGSTNEWNEFLKLLKGNRPNCPINGMVLVIPVDTLIKDTADSIEKKATKIAQQFDQIQRILGVRFPVFIIITKCDLLNGFREFFDDLNDPQLQHQIMGWSNPGSLDDKFDPKAVTNHMETVKARLAERRHQLLLDPINTEDQQARRIDQVDALYALPDSLSKIAPRLRRYLEMVFVAGEWSPKPLFLRGIYFTSSMTEGSALDAELAEVLGVPVDSLPEGRVWRRDRAYFLRDLFIEKVFREKGLVTRATNAEKQQRSRRAVVMTVGFLAVIILFAVTFLGARNLEKNIGSQRDFWVAAAKNKPEYMQLVNLKKDNAYNTEPFTVGTQKDVTVASFFGNNLDSVQKPIQIPVIFHPMAFLSGDVNTERVKAYRALYEATILHPVYAAARRKLAALTPATWSDDATGSLEQLMKLEYADALAHKTPVGETHPQVDLDPLLRFILPSADYPKAQHDEENLQKAVDWIYSKDATDGLSSWPPAALAPEDAVSRKVVDEGVDNAIAYWAGQVTEANPRMSNILTVRSALVKFRDAEAKLELLKTRSVLKVDPYEQYVKDWNAALKALTDARTQALTEWAAASKGAPDNSTLTSLYTAALDRIGADAQKAYADLLRLTPADAPDASKPNDNAKALYADHQKVQAALASLNDWKNGPKAKAILADIAALDDYLLPTKAADGTMRRRFEIHAQLYQLADDKLLPEVPASASAAAPPAAPLSAALAKIDADVTASGDTIVKLVGGATPQDPLTKAGDLVRSVIDTGARYRRYAAVNAALAALPADPAGWETYIANLAAKSFADHLVRPVVPLIVADKTYPAKFSPDAVGAAFDVISAIDKLSKNTGAGAMLDADRIAAQSAQVKTGLDGYLPNYRKYWQKDVFEELRFPSKDWKEFSAGFVGIKEQTIRSALEDYGARAKDALARIADTAGATAIETEIQMARNGGFKDECADILSHWKDLSDDYHQTRRTILAMDPNKFFEGYVVSSAMRLDSFIARYWTSLTIAGLRVIANDSTKDINAGLAELTKYQRFPLAPPGDKADDLSPPDVLKARAALELVKGATTADLAGGARSIGQGGLTKDKEVDATLELLRGAYLLRQQQDYLDRLQRFFAALPTDAKPLTVNLSVVKDKLKDSGAVSVRYGYMGIFQGKELREAFLQGDVPDAVDIEYPGDDLRLEFREVPKGPIIQTDTFPGPWAVFHLIRSPNVKVIDRKGPKWTLEYTVKDPGGKTWLLWIGLTFNTELPDLKDWPVPPTK